MEKRPASGREVGMPSGVLDPRVKARSKADGRADTQPPPGTNNSGNPRPGGLTLETSTPRATGVFVQLGTGGSESGSLNPRSPWGLGAAPGPGAKALAAPKVPNLPPWMESCPCRGLQPPPGLRGGRAANLASQGTRDPQQLSSPGGQVSPPRMHPGHWDGLWR